MTGGEGTVLDELGSRALAWQGPGHLKLVDPDGKLDGRRLRDPFGAGLERSI